MRRRETIESAGSRVTRIQPMISPTETPATPMISTKSFSGKGRGCSKVGEAVGGTAAVICCFPLAVINLVVLAVYKVPSGLLKRAWNRKKKKQRRRLLSNKNKNSSSLDLDESDGQPKTSVGPWPVGLGLILSSDDEDETETDKLELLEAEMYGQFYRGFWRSPSQKGD